MSPFPREVNGSVEVSRARLQLLLCTPPQCRLLQRAQATSQDPEFHVESARPAYLLCQDTYYVGIIKGVGRIYLQSVVDAFCSLAFGKLYLSKLPM